MPHNMSDADYLRHLAECVRQIPIMYGVDDYDIDRLYEIAATASTEKPEPIEEDES